MNHYPELIHGGRRGFRCITFALSATLAFVFRNSFLGVNKPKAIAKDPHAQLCAERLLFSASFLNALRTKLPRYQPSMYLNGVSPVV